MNENIHQVRYICHVCIMKRRGTRCHHRHATTVEGIKCRSVMSPTRGCLGLVVTRLHLRCSCASPVSRRIRMATFGGEMKQTTPSLRSSSLSARLNCLHLQITHNLCSNYAEHEFTLHEDSSKYDRSSQASHRNRLQRWGLQLSSPIQRFLVQPTTFFKLLLGIH